MRFAAIFVAFLFTFVTVPAGAREPGPAGMVDAAIAGYLQPGYDTLRAQAEELEARVDALCGRPSGDTLAGAREAFAGLVDAWSRVEFVRLGPAAEENRAQRFNAVSGEEGLRLVQEILAERDASAAVPDTLQDRNAAVQGLGALDYVLFGSGNETLVERRDPFRCAYAHAVAANLHAIAAALAAGWEDGARAPQLLRAPGADNPLYNSHGTALSAIAAVLPAGFADLRDARLGLVLGTDTRDAAPRRAAFRRGALTLAALRANLEGLRTLYVALEVPRNLDGDSAWIDANVHFEFDHALAALEEVTLPLDEALADETQRGKLSYVRVVMDTLWTLTARDVPAVLGLRASGGN